MQGHHRWNSTQYDHLYVNPTRGTIRAEVIRLAPTGRLPEGSGAACPRPDAGCTGIEVRALADSREYSTSCTWSSAATPISRNPSRRHCRRASHVFPQFQRREPGNCQVDLGLCGTLTDHFHPVPGGGPVLPMAISGRVAQSSHAGGPKASHRRACHARSDLERHGPLQ